MCHWHTATARASRRRKGRLLFDQGCAKKAQLMLVYIPLMAHRTPAALAAAAASAQRIASAAAEQDDGPQAGVVAAAEITAAPVSVKENQKNQDPQNGTSISAFTSATASAVCSCQITHFVLLRNQFTLYCMIVQKKCAYACE